MCPTSLHQGDGCRDDPSSAGDTIRRVKVAIVGAGASGLQCCNTLVKEYGVDVSDILLLEARNRVGGRVHTTMEHATNVVDGTAVSFPLDHGAAWVHGTGLDWGCTTAVSLPTDQLTNNNDVEAKPISNPMMDLLFQETEANGGDDPTNMYERHLNPVFTGNPWMRPREVLHRKGQLSICVAGRQLNETNLDDERVISKALTRHFSTMREAHQVGLDLFNERRGMETATTSLGETIATVLATNQSYHEQLASLPAQDAELVRALAPFYLFLVECWYGCAATDLQLCEFTEETETIPEEEDTEYRCEGDFTGPHCTLRRGMTSVLQPLLYNGVREQILLQQEVTGIACHDVGEFKLVALDTASGLRVHADACVVTIPAGCVKDAVSRGVFTTRLSDEKLKAISYMKMGSYKKVFLSFDRIFWPRQPPFLGLIRRVHSVDTSGLGNHLLVDNLWATRDIPSIEAVLFGDAGAWSIHKADGEIRDAVLEFMADAMGLPLDDLQTYCQSCHVTRWEEDPFSRGAYSSLALGALESHVEELRRPEWDGRLAFAGEATISEFEGSVYAALFSGIAAAKQVDAYLSGAVSHDIK